MPISSMTGFARSSGEHQGLYWQWEIKSVNGMPAEYEEKSMDKEGTMDEEGMRNMVAEYDSEMES